MSIFSLLLLFLIANVLRGVSEQLKNKGNPNFKPPETIGQCPDASEGRIRTDDILR